MVRFGLSLDIPHTNHTEDQRRWFNRRPRVAQRPHRARQVARHHQGQRRITPTTSSRCDE